MVEKETNRGVVYQTSLDEKIVFSNKVNLPHFKEVTSEVPCFSCADNFAPTCDVIGCQKLTSWSSKGLI